MRALDYVLSLAQRMESERFEADLVNAQEVAVGISGLMGRMWRGMVWTSGTRGLGTVSGLVLGSVATKVIHLVNPSVTLVT